MAIGHGVIFERNEAFTKSQLHSFVTARLVHLPSSLRFQLICCLRNLLFRAMLFSLNANLLPVSCKEPCFECTRLLKPVEPCSGCVHSVCSWKAGESLFASSRPITGQLLEQNADFGDLIIVPCRVEGLRK